MSTNGVTTHELNYVTANRFYVEINSDIKASFTECSGLGVQIEKETYSEGGVNDQQRFFLKQPRFDDVTLKRGITNDLSFWGWSSQVLQGMSGKRLNVNILLFNQAGETMQSWTLIGAIPVGWKGASFQADGTSVAIEELTLAYEGLNITSPQPKGITPSKEIKGHERDKNSGYFPSN